MPLQKKFYADDSVDGAKLLFLNNQALRAKNNGGSAVDIMKLDASDILQLLQMPRVSSDASNDNELVRKSQMDTGLGLKEASANKGAASGYCPLGADTKVATAYLPDSVVGQVEYQGTWNASTNSPALSNSGGGGSKGHYHKVATAGTSSVDGIAEWAVGDWIIHNGTVWEKVDNTDQVSSVAGKQGAVTLDTDDVSEAANLYHTAQRARDAISFNKESNTLDGTDITNQYVDLGFEIKSDSLFAAHKDGLVGLEGYHYTLSLEGGVTRVTFAGPWATSGSEELIATNVLYFKYMKKSA